ncbi:HD domain-containing protein [Streptomyces rubiginosohelvolus]|uniref:HD domain-containing protein n=1 Tax=Streptomyces rubiginosohelvolus TaxID=67362 RepID=UPI00378E9282
MTEGLQTTAEVRAQAAIQLEAFGGINIIHVRRQVAQLVELIGIDGIFDEYTKHDMKHVDGMLKSLDWIIPKRTKEIMTVGDWLLTVLGVYFHDLGMLVTKEEYRNRSNSGFEEFKRNTLLTNDDDGKNYEFRLEELRDVGVDIERMQYQEYVRHHHATRIKNWILGDAPAKLGVSLAAQEIVSEILAPLGQPFREDLAFVCESHHLDNLYDTDKYPVSNPYGLDREECANVQYSAVLLRTADLLHMTKDRTPSFTYRLITPADPISQFEWAKQEPVRSVRHQMAKKPDGSADPHGEPDTVEVYANFTSGQAYFGLTSYLDYAEQQLQQSNRWVLTSREMHAAPHEFPWRSIDSRNVKAKGFLPQQFRFSLDQRKVLDLLTGHTLYNDSRVVLRELLQNSIDAVRLRYQDKSEELGRVWIKWDSEKRILEVGDNGTGMTQRVIKDNLLKAGSSLYQEEEFKKKNPDFSPISRFGIGVMSTFMIADTVEVITAHADEEEGRQLSLRTAHGQYLVQLLNKAGSEIPEDVSNNGTIVRLKVRHSVETDSIFEAAHDWVVMPRCHVSMEIDGAESVRVGFSTLTEALRAAMLNEGTYTEKDFTESKVQIKCLEDKEFSIAYALQRDDYFKTWSFIYLRDHEPWERAVDIPQGGFGICVEGIKVESTSPGFSEYGGIWALVNSCGLKSPRTDVARKSLDATPARETLMRDIYNSYAKHIENEVKELQVSRGQSLTFAVQEGTYMARILALRQRRRSQASEEFNVALRSVPLFLAEDITGIRRQYSASDLEAFSALHCREGNISYHAEHLLRDISSTVSRTSLMKALGEPINQIQQNEALLCTTLSASNPLHRYVSEVWQPARLVANLESRYFDVMLEKSPEPRWSKFKIPRELQVEAAEKDLRGSFAQFLAPLSKIELSGFSEDIFGVRMGGQVFLLPEHPWKETVDSFRDTEGQLEPGDERLATLLWLIATCYSAGQAGYFITGNAAKDFMVRLSGIRSLNAVDLNSFSQILNGATEGKRLLDTSYWTRTNEVA